MNTPKAYRWSPKLAEQIKAHHGQMKFKNEKQAVEDLIQRGLATLGKSGDESGERRTTLNEVRALSERVKEILTQLSADQGSNPTKEMLAEVQSACNRIECLAQPADAVMEIIADIQNSHKEMTNLRKFDHLLTIWSSAYNQAIVSGVEEPLLKQFRDYLDLISAGSSLLRRLGIGDSISEQINLERRIL